MTAQELFDKALFGIRKQGSPGSEGVSGCMYLTVDGRKCGIGHVAEEGDIDTSFNIGDDGGTVNYTSILDIPEDALSNRFYNIRAAHGDLMSEIQGAHDIAHMNTTLRGVIDNAAFLLRYNEEMQEIAARHGLTYTAP